MDPLRRCHHSPSVDRVTRQIRIEVSPNEHSSAETLRSRHSKCLKCGHEILFSVVGQFMGPGAKALTKLSNLRWCQSMKFKRLVRHTIGSQQRLTNIA